MLGNMNKLKLFFVYALEAFWAGEFLWKSFFFFFLPPGKNANRI